MSTANEYGGEDKRHEIVQNTIPAMVLAALAVAARFAARRIQRGRLEWHDWFIVLGLIGSLLQSALVIDSAAQGIGLHINFVSPENIRAIFILEYTSKIDYALTFTFVKMSILLLYRAIFTGRGFAIATNIIMGYVVAWGVAVVLVSIFSCNPVNGFWDTDIPSTCVSSILFFEWTTLTNVLGDVMILALPVRKVWKLQMSTEKKIAVLGMFLLGGFVVVATIIRLIYMMKMDVTDATWTYVDPAIWFTVELNVAVISACLPTLRPLVQRLWPAALASSISSYLSRHTYNHSRGSSKNSNSSSKKARNVSQDSDTTSTILITTTTASSDLRINEKDPAQSLASPSSTYTAPSSPSPMQNTKLSTGLPSTTSHSLLYPHQTSRSIPTPKSLTTTLTSQPGYTTQPSPSNEPLSPTSLASIPMPPPSVPMPAPGPGCFQPEDLDRSYSNHRHNRHQRGQQHQQQQYQNQTRYQGRNQQGKDERVRSWAQYAISDAGITDTGRLGVDFGDFGGKSEKEIGESIIGEEIWEEEDSERGSGWRGGRFEAAA